MRKLKIVAPCGFRRLHFGANLLRRERVNLRHIHLLQLLPRPAIKLHSGGIGVDNRAILGIDDEHDRVIIFKHTAIAFFALTLAHKGGVDLMLPGAQEQIEREAGEADKYQPLRQLNPGLQRRWFGKQPHQQRIGEYDPECSQQAIEQRDARGVQARGR